MWKRIDVTGEKFGKLTAIRNSGFDKTSRSLWECICECGGTKTVTITKLRTGVVRSCGCLLLEPRHVTHGKSDSSTFRTWANMKYRCSNPKNRDWKHYGGRGIKFCDRWKRFENFLEDMGDRPPGKSLERINVNGDYEPSNCRWAGVREQQQNKRNTVRLTIGSQTKTISEWSEIYGVDPSMIAHRIRKKWPLERLFTKYSPSGKYDPDPSKYGIVEIRVNDISALMIPISCTVTESSQLVEILKKAIESLKSPEFLFPRYLS